MKNTTTERQNHQITPFTYEDHAVRTVMIKNEPWWVAKDICESLGLGNPANTLADFPDDEKGLISIDTLGGPQKMLVVNEQGLYRTIFNSRKPEAEKFKTWVFAEVLPQIRQTGAYAVPGAGSRFDDFIDIIKRQMTVIENLVQELNATGRNSPRTVLSPVLESNDGEIWLNTTELSALYGKTRATTLSHARAMNWDMRISRTKNGSLTYEFRLASLPESLRAAWGKHDPYAARPGFPLALPEKEAGHE